MAKPEYSNYLSYVQVYARVLTGVDQLYGNTFPLIYLTINKYQRKDNELVEKLKYANYHTKSFRGGGNTFMLIC